MSREFQKYYNFFAIVKREWSGHDVPRPQVILFLKLKLSLRARAIVGAPFCISQKAPQVWYFCQKSADADFYAELSRKIRKYTCKAGTSIIQ